MKKGKMFLVYLLVAGILSGNSMSVFATEKVAIAEAESEEQEADKGNVITGFQELEQTYFEWKEKYPLTEALATFPETITVELGGNKTEEIPVTWKCMDDYEATQLRVYEFLPYWDEEKYLLSNELDEYWDVPFIQVTVPLEVTEKEQADVDVTRRALKQLLGAESVQAVVCLCDKYAVRQEADPQGQAVVYLTSGTTVQIEDVAMDAYRNVWYQISCDVSRQSYTGYIEKKNLAYTNETFQKWEEKYEVVFTGYNTIEKEEVTVKDVDIEQFPASYQIGLKELKKKHPNWIFVKQNITLDWNTAVKMQGSSDYSLVRPDAEAACKGKYYGPGWYYASAQAISYYMDPRNFLDDTGIFQFQQLFLPESAVSYRVLESILDNAFLAEELQNEEGILTLAEDYLAKGQDTLYLLKFNIEGRYYGLYNHQYTKNICTPYAQACIVEEIYENAGAPEEVFIFKIPVYKNMPQTPCSLPGEVIEEDQPVKEMDMSNITGMSKLAIQTMQEKQSETANKEENIQRPVSLVEIIFAVAGAGIMIGLYIYENGRKKIKRIQNK